MKHVARPSIIDVARGFQAIGLASNALDLLRAVGLKEVPIARATDVKPKYQREKNRSAYIHVGIDVDAKAQHEMLVALHEKLSKEPEFSWLPAIDSQHLLKIALPGPRVVFAYRVDLKAYLASALPAILTKSKCFQVYTRKPRADAQKHCLTQEN